MDFTAMGAWPQWAIVAYLFVYLLIFASNHGKPRVHTVGESKGETQKYNAFVAFMRVSALVFILIAGGFFA